jgi:hypothetical protein
MLFGLSLMRSFSAKRAAGAEGSSFVGVVGVTSSSQLQRVADSKRINNILIDAKMKKSRQKSSISDGIEL